MSKIYSFLESVPSTKLKQKTYFQLENWKDIINFANNAFSPTTGMNLDGVIVQKKNEPYIRKEPPFTVSFKLKRHVLNTIDFMIKYDTTSKQYFMYLYGSYSDLIYNLKVLPKVNRYSKSHTGIELIHGVKLPSKMYILFCSVFKENVHVFTPRKKWSKRDYKKEEVTIINNLMGKMISNPMEFDGKIIEFSLAIDGWVPMRMRNDKMYANSFRTGVSTMSILFSPINLNETRYFAKNIEKTELIILWHKCNQFIRKSMYEKVFQNIEVPARNIIDLAGGRGADIPYFMDHNIKNIIAVDADTEALVQYNSRLERLRKSNIYFNAVAGILSENNADIVSDIINRQEYSKKGVDFITMNYAFHYLCSPDNKKIIELAKTIRKITKPDAYFMFSYFDGDKILKDSQMNIVKLKNFTIEIIDDHNVKMPLPSIDETGYRDEPLVTKEKIDALEFKPKITFYPVEDHIDELSKMDPGKNVIDYLKYVCVCLMQITPDITLKETFTPETQEIPTE